MPVASFPGMTTTAVPAPWLPARSRRVRLATAADLGLSPLAGGLVAAQLALAAGLAVAAARSPVTIAWTTAGAQAGGIGSLLLLWLSLCAVPGRTRRDWIVAETVAILILILTCSLLTGAGQYLVAGWVRPLTDPTLAAADAWLGVSVPALVAWTRPHPWITFSLQLAYFTLIPQFVLAIVGTGIVLRDRARLREFAFHFHFCAIVTLVCSGLFPAASAFTFYGFESLLDQGRFIDQFASLRAGTLPRLRFDTIEGLISFPSFHVAGALMVTWAFRGRRAWSAALVVLNLGLIAATMLLGAHYAVDVLGTVVLFAASIGVYRSLALETPPEGGRYVRMEML